MERAESRKPVWRVWSSPVGHIPREYGGCEKPQYEPRKRRPKEQAVPSGITTEVAQINAIPDSGSIDFATLAVQETFI